jgi:hypothetical protein
MTEEHPMKIRYALCAIALAATQLAHAHPEREPELQLMGGPMRHDILYMAGAQLEQERVVQGAPYCADATHEAVQELADGNRIVQRQISRQCRDGQGRTRQEIRTPDGRVRVYLRDPVAHEVWMLDTDRKLAVRLNAPPIAMGANARPHVWDRFIVWGQGVGEKIRHTFGRTPDASAQAAYDAPELGRAPGMAPSPPLALHARLLGPRGPGATTMLPGESIDGLRADGKRTVWTIEAGKIGNEKPITIVNEVWSSPELGITLKTRDVDPVVGEASFRVQNVARGEPDPQLFKVPAEFSKVTPPNFGIRTRP